MRQLCLWIGTALVVVGAAGCGSSTPLTSASPTLTTETFNGTVQVQGTDFHNFTVAQAGEVDVTLTAAGPPATIAMGLGVGAVSGGVCSSLIGSTTTQAGTAAQLSGTLSAGTYCVVVADVGNQSAPVAYTVTVAHP